MVSALVIPPEDRAPYHEALHVVQLRGDRQAWHQFMFARLHTALDHHLETLRRASTV